LLRNESNILPFKAGTKVYFEKYMVTRGSENPHNVVAPLEHNWDVEFVNSADEADVVVLWLFPKSAGLFGSRGDEIHIELSKNSIDIEYVNSMKDKKPTVVVINFSSPWVISEIEKEKTETVLATFGTTTDALLDILSGKFNPTGKMPVSIPSSYEAVINNQSDVPGYQKGEEYCLFKFNDGISY
jgi:beta-glucosidase